MGKKVNEPGLIKEKKKIGIDSKLSINGQEKIMIIHVLDWKI